MRLPFIDNLRWTMIFLVISMHAADTYSPLGSWYFTDRSPLSRPELLAFAFWQMFLQSFFMGLLFFVAAYFTPPAFDRKGTRRFLQDRLFRLGLPVLFYMFVLGPVTEYFVAHSWTSSRPTSFANEWIKHIRNGEFLQENGPLWFCLALLIFSFVYAGGRAVFHRDVPPTAPPGSAKLTGGMLVLAGATLLVGLAHPPTVFNLHLPDFPQYILLFIAGIFAARGQWLAKLPAAAGSRWLIAALTLGPALWLWIMEAGCAFCNGQRLVFYPWILLFRLWEAFSCVAMSLGLLVLFREHFAAQGRAGKFFSDNAFAVYVFHPPIVILGARMFHGFAWHPLLKFGVLTVFGVVVSYALSGLLFRRVPVLKAIL